MVAVGRRWLVSLCCAMCLALWTGRARAQGGPPLITEDPGTPGPGRWEINAAFVAEKLRSQTLIEVPALDINYGLGERIQPWLYGLAAAWPLSERVELVGEVFGVGERRFHEDVLVFNLGGIVTLYEKVNLPPSAGRSLREQAPRNLNCSRTWACSLICDN